MKGHPGVLAAVAMLALPRPAAAQEAVGCGAGGYASYAPWRLARSTRHWGDQSRIMQNRPLFLTPEMAARVAEGEPIPTNDWWTDALVNRWTGNLWSYPAKVRIGADGVRVAFPSYWIDDGTEMKERTAVVISGGGDFAPESADVAGWHDWDVELELRDAAGRRMLATLVHGSPFTWVEFRGVAPSVAFEGGEPATLEKNGGGRLVRVGDDLYGIWGDGRTFVAVGLAPNRAAFATLSEYAYAIIRSTRVGWRYDETTATLRTTWNVETEDLLGRAPSPPALQGFQPHHLKGTKPGFATIPGIAWQTPRGRQRAAVGNSLSIDYPFPGMLPYWAMPDGAARGAAYSGAPAFDAALMRDLASDYAARGTFGGDTYWGGKGLLQMAFAMMAAREGGDAETFRAAHAKLRARFEDWLTWSPGEERFFFSYVPKWGGLVGEGTSYDSDTFNDHHFHYGYFTYAGALLCLVDDDFRDKFGPMLSLIARDYANWDRAERRFPFMRTFDPWAGHSFAGGLGDGNGNGQESSSEAMQGWGGLYLLGLALGDDAMRDAGIFGYVSEARAIAEYWFDRDRENIDYSKYAHPYNSNLTCHGVGWWTYFSGDPVWMHSIQWLPNTPALDYLSEDLEFAKWDWETMWKTKEIGGWFENGVNRAGDETPPVGNESLGNVLLSYLQRHDPAQAARVFDELRRRGYRAATAPDTAHMTYWATHSHLDYGTPDFSVRADWPCARAFVTPDGRRTLAAYNTGDRPRTVRFFDGKGNAVGELTAPPRCLTVGGRAPSPLRIAASDLPAAPLIPEGVAMRDIARGRPVEVSSSESGGLGGGNVTDGDDTTRWSSAHDDPESTATIDLGAEYALYGAEIVWENSFAARYALERSGNGRDWRPIGGERSGHAGPQRLDFGGERARYVRMRALEKATQYGVSIFSWRVFGRKVPADGTNAPLGLAIKADRDVLKEGVPARLSVMAWYGGATMRPVDAEWASDDGEFPAGRRGAGVEFIPGTNGFAAVAVKAGGMDVTRCLPVEEALAVSTLEFAATNVVALAGEPVRIEISAKDQFGGEMALTGVRMRMTDSAGRPVPREFFRAQKGGTIEFARPGRYLLSAMSGAVAAECAIEVGRPGSVNLARLAKVSASGEENGSLAPRFAVDGDPRTRWGSRHRDGEWISLDFGRERTISRCAIDWENARAAEYRLEARAENGEWRTVAKCESTAAGRAEHTFAPIRARHFRITGVRRGTDYGISIFEIDVR
ncbi:MAG: discoidin domain-containing protein [Kiritimatiellae bacterium]|nr:discoidin domain-containing protein [Kiritimatiellia bacterium]